MSKNKSRKIIDDKMWSQLELALKKAKHSQAGAPSKLSDRDFIEAVLYLNRTGCPWRDLPAQLGHWHAVYMRFRRWQKRGVWKRLWQELQNESLAEASTLFMDSTSMRAHQHAAGALKKTIQIRLWGALEVG